VAAPKAPVLDATAKKARDVTLDAAVFAADVKPQLVHQAVRAEQNARRAGTRAAKSRGLVSGGRSKAWRQKGTGRARAGSIRAPQFTGGGLAFPPQPRRFEQKVNRKERHAALRAALGAHVRAGTFGVLSDDAFDSPSTREAAEFLAEWGKELPLVVVAAPEQEPIVKSFRNLDRVAVVPPSELEVSALVWARSALVTEAALDVVKRRAGGEGG
jgi:large subunit ribosomal protein L4